MREQRVALENGIDLPFVCWQFCHVFAVKKDIAAIRENEAADNTQRRRLAAAGRTQQRDELSVGDVEV